MVVFHSDILTTDQATDSCSKCPFTPRASRLTNDPQSEYRPATTIEISVETLNTSIFDLPFAMCLPFFGAAMEIDEFYSLPAAGAAFLPQPRIMYNELKMME